MAPKIFYSVVPAHLQAMKKLPWRHPIEQWRKLGVKHLDIKQGAGRHPVVFVRVAGQDYVIKELGLEAAKREVENYSEILARGVHTLVPVGYVAREEALRGLRTRIGVQYEKTVAAHSVTLLMDRVVPDSFLYRRAFKPENRQRIWDAIVDLFVELHTNGIYWGDASLANTLVKFLKVEIPHIGKRTQLKAYLADAETVEIHKTISDSLRQADIDFFLESMDWLNEDLRASGIVRDDLATASDKEYVQTQYEKMFDVAVEGKEFERRHGIDMRRYLGPVRDVIYFDTLDKHIAEHKWYLSEREKQEVDMKVAAQDWLDHVFLPTCELFKREGVLDFFPGKTASELYVETMTHKYYLSKEQQSDVGILFAIRDYARRFGHEDSLAAFWSNLAEKMRDILGLGARVLLGLVE
jgi:hypothetical protein